jgi:hypothetical protein
MDLWDKHQSEGLLNRNFHTFLLSILVLISSESFPLSQFIRCLIKEDSNSYLIPIVLSISRFQSRDTITPGGRNQMETQLSSSVDWGRLGVGREGKYE